MAVCRGRPSPRQAPYDVVEKVLGLQGDEYFDFNVKLLHEPLVAKHGISCSHLYVLLTSDDYHIDKLQTLTYA